MDGQGNLMVVPASAARKAAGGFTLLEMLIAMMILAIIISIAIPGMSQFSANQRLVGAAEQVSGHLQQARSEAVASNRQVFVNFASDGTATWQYGVSYNSLCDLTATAATSANACVIVVNDGDGLLDPGDGSVDMGDLVLMRYTNTDNQGVRMAIANFSSGNSQFVFDPLRGTSSAGQINLTAANGNQLRVRVSLLGRVNICTQDSSMGAYQDC